MTKYTIAIPLCRGRLVQRKVTNPSAESSILLASADTWGCQVRGRGIRVRAQEFDSPHLHLITIPH